MPFCTECGARIEGALRFCTGCGAALDSPFLPGDKLPAGSGVKVGVGSVTPAQLTMAGWVSIAYGALQLPLVFLSLLAYFSSGSSTASLLDVIDLILSLLGGGVLIWLLWFFRKFLNERHGFHRVDTFISLFIGASLLLMLVTLKEFGNKPNLSDPLTAQDMFFLVAAVVLGIVIIGFGALLLSLPNDLFGLLKPYCYTTIGSGICLASVLLSPLAILGASVGGVLLGMIFLRSAERPIGSPTVSDRG